MRGRGKKPNLLQERRAPSNTLATMSGDTLGRQITRALKYKQFATLERLLKEARKNGERVKISNVTIKAPLGKDNYLPTLDLSDIECNELIFDGIAIGHLELNNVAIKRLKFISDGKAQTASTRLRINTSNCNNSEIGNLILDAAEVGIDHWENVSIDLINLTKYGSLTCKLADIRGSRIALPDMGHGEWKNVTVGQLNQLDGQGSIFKINFNDVAIDNWQIDNPSSYGTNYAAQDATWKNVRGKNWQWGMNHTRVYGGGASINRCQLSNLQVDNWECKSINFADTILKNSKLPNMKWENINMRESRITNLDFENGNFGLLALDNQSMIQDSNFRNGKCGTWRIINQGLSRCNFANSQIEKLHLSKAAALTNCFWQGAVIENIICEDGARVIHTDSKKDLMIGKKSTLKAAPHPHSKPEHFSGFDQRAKEIFGL